MKTNLNFGWKFSPDFDETYIVPSFNDSAFQSVNIPHTVKETPYNNFDEKMYQLVSCYRNTFTIPAEYAGKTLILEFEAVANFAEVYVNGDFAFAHKGSYTAFNVDITDLAKVGETNTIVVKVDSTERPEIPPFGKVVDFLVNGGIYREVYLYAKNEDFIKEIMIAPVTPVTEPKIDLKMTFNRVTNIPASVRLLDKDGVAVMNFEVNPKGKAYLHVVQNVTTPITLWDINNPYLYTIEVDYAGEIKTDRFGFREVSFTNKGFFLNRKPIKIRGLNRHQSYPYVGYAMPKQAQISDADYLKYDLGVNLARTSHYPNSKHFLNRCDEIGLLVFTEIPGWQYVSDNAEWRNICLQHVKEMIFQDYNHPSIIIWGVRINESNDDHELYTRTNELAHKLDFSRPTGGVRCTPQSELLEDVYTFNDFNHNGSNSGLMPKLVVCSPKAPLLITEHNGHMFPTKTFDHEKKRQEQALRHAKVLNDVYKRRNTSGAIGWCMSDYNTHKDFGSGDKICYHGVSDMFRMDKLAAFTYKSQQDLYPVLEVSSNMEIGDNAGGQVGNVYMFTNCDKVKLYKGGLHINTFDIAALAKRSDYKHLPHPPVKLYDIIGDQIVKSNKFNKGKKDADIVKRFLLDIKQYGTFGSIFRHLPTCLMLLLKYKLSITEITLLFGTYVTGWGDEAIEYKFEGIKGDQSVTVTKASVTNTKLETIIEKNTLVEDETYDTCRIGVKAVSQTGSILPYSNDVISITCSKNIEIIGETTVALIGGQRAFWIKTIGKAGKANVTITSRMGTVEIPLMVEKIKQN